MVHAVVVWRIEDVFKRTNCSDCVCVDPELEEHVQVLMGYELCRGYGQGQR